MWCQARTDGLTWYGMDAVLCEVEDQPGGVGDEKDSHWNYSQFSLDLYNISAEEEAE